MSRAFLQRGLLVGPAELALSYRWEDPQGRVGVKIVAQLAYRPVTQEKSRLCFATLPAESNYGSDAARTPAEHLEAWLLELLCQFLRLCRLDKNHRRLKPGIPEEAMMLRNVLGSDDFRWRELLSWF